MNTVRGVGSVEPVWCSAVQHLEPAVGVVVRIEDDVAKFAKHGLGTAQRALHHDVRQTLKRLSPFWLLNITAWIAAGSIIYFVFRAIAERPDTILKYVLLNYPLGLLLTIGLRYLPAFIPKIDFLRIPGDNGDSVFLVGSRFVARNWRSIDPWP